MTVAEQLLLASIFCAAFIFICLKVGGLVTFDPISYPRAYWFGIACFGLMVIVLLLVVTWRAAASL